MIEGRLDPVLSGRRNRRLRERPPEGLPSPVINLARGDMHANQDHVISFFGASSQGFRLFLGQLDVVKIVHRDLRQVSTSLPYREIRYLQVWYDCYFLRPATGVWRRRSRAVLRAGPIR